MSRVYEKMNTEEMIDNTIANLKVIGMIQKNGRLAVRKGQLTIESDDHLQTIRRWLNKDSRDLALMHIRNTVNNAIKLSKGMINNTVSTELKTWALHRLATEMQNCQSGLVNLKTTYANDSLMVANLDVMNDRLIAHHKELFDFISLSQGASLQGEKNKVPHVKTDQSVHPNNK